MEPTFTLRTSEDPEWLSEPLGGTKLQLAQKLLASLRDRHPGAIVLRTLGRQYEGERKPRWSLGLYERRDGGPLWEGPTDPLDGEIEPCTSQQLESFHQDLLGQILRLGWEAYPIQVERELPRRVLFRIDDGEIPDKDRTDERWSRPSVHQHTIPLTGLVDDLASEGIYLICIGLQDSAQGKPCATLELPAFPDVTSFCLFLSNLAKAAAALPALILQGFPPPIDATIAWTTVTPDPAVIEINQAPYPNSAKFLSASRELYTLTANCGLTPYRLQYNGRVTDSGGGGQFTLGGSSPETSPFLAVPNLLPRLLRYVIHHPSLSYWFAPDYLGGCSQSPRPDEGIRELFRELHLAMAQMERQSSPEPEFIWRSFAPFLTDPSGNSHRSDINIEKLWNPHLPGRGCQGLVEFRAFRMPLTPERAAAITALLRAVVTMLMRKNVTPQLTDWGDELHDRFSLPYFLQQDLQSVFTDLDESELKLGPALQEILESGPHADIWQMDFQGCHLEIESALEFWPLVGGDVASQENGGSRLVDASTIRWQVLIRSPETKLNLGVDLNAWQISCEDIQIPLRNETNQCGEVRLLGLRLREFQPWIGLHPAIQPRIPLHLTLSHPDVEEALHLTLHGWQPDSQPYPGLPTDLDDARIRRHERLTVEVIPRSTLTPIFTPPVKCLTDYSLDLRWLAD